eukprot:3563926-Ditylum_brightwellii.AAC.1
MLDMLEDGTLGNCKRGLVNFESKSKKRTAIARTHVQKKYIYLMIVLEAAPEKYPQMLGVVWENCCCEACEMMKSVPVGCSPVTNWRTIQRWFLEFKANDQKLIIPADAVKEKMTY